MRRENMKVFIQHKSWNRMLELYFYEERPDHSCDIVIAEGYRTMNIPEGADLPKFGTLSITHEMAQVIVDALNESGYKPKEGALEAELRATQAHLADMRRLALGENVTVMAPGDPLLPPIDPRA